MRLVTSCPACNAAFYVSAGQLKAHQGNVRCGQCEHVFNALDRLAKVDDAATSQPPGAAEAGELAGVTTPVTQQPVTQQKDTQTARNQPRQSGRYWLTKRLSN
jgi:predicted Zn finger-like uncharacterized protein